MVTEGTLGAADVVVLRGKAVEAALRERGREAKLLGNLGQLCEWQGEAIVLQTVISRGSDEGCSGG